MFSESYRPQTVEDIFGHDEVKRSLTEYLTHPPKRFSMLLHGTPGIGKTTLALAAARSLNYEPLEVNASRMLRSNEDVQKLRDSCMASVSFLSLVKYTVPRKTCVILDEIDGSDPHAQRKVLEWIQDETRSVPILMTANEEPVIFKRAKANVQSLRCLPCSAHVLYEHLSPPCSLSEFQVLAKECLHDVRRIWNRIQYGHSDPVTTFPLTGDPLRDLHRQIDAFYKTDPIRSRLESTDTEQYFSRLPH
jgi:hypothetical protein